MSPVQYIGPAQPGGAPGRFSEQENVREHSQLQGSDGIVSSEDRGKD